MPKYEVLGRNTFLEGNKFDEGSIVKDDRDLVAMFPGKFRLLTTGKKKVAAAETDHEEEDVVDTTPKRDKSAVLDGGPTQPTPPNGSLDQNMRNSGFRGDEPGGSATGKKADPNTGEDGEEENKEGDAGRAAAKKPAGKRKKSEEHEEEEEYHDASDEFPEAKKADLAVFKYAGGEYQVFDADDKDDPNAKPVNDGPLKTEKQVKAFLKKYHS